MFNDTLHQRPKDHQIFGGSMLTSYVMDHDMDVHIHVRFFRVIFNLYSRQSELSDS